MRLGWSPSTQGARRAPNATVPAYANDQPRPSQKPTRMQGGGVWVEHLRWAAPESFALFLKAFTCMYRSGWGRRVPAGSKLIGPQDFSGGT